MSPFAKIFASLVEAGDRKIKDVPGNLLEEVKQILRDKNVKFD